MNELCKQNLTLFDTSTGSRVNMNLEFLFAKISCIISNIAYFSFSVEIKPFTRSHEGEHETAVQFTKLLLACLDSAHTNIKSFLLDAKCVLHPQTSS